MYPSDKSDTYELNLEETLRRVDSIRTELQSTERSLDQILRVVLDELGELLGSPFGFYHFIEDDQETILVQQWSTKTRELFCDIGDKGELYPISKQGVWADCVQLRKSIIHNECKSLPTKQIFLERSESLIREVVVPVIRDGKVKCILGIGNKPENYSSQDESIVCLFANFTWDLIESRKTHEELREITQNHKSLLKNSSEGYALHKIHTDRDGKATDYTFLEINPAFTELTGLGSEVIGKRVTDVIPDVEPSWIERYGQCALNGISSKFSGCSEPLSKIFEVSCFSPMRGYFATTFSDITKKMETEELIRETMENYRNFSRELAHDMKTPIASISTILELCKDQFEDISDWELLKEAQNQLESTIKDMAKLNYIDKEGCECHPIDLESWSRKVLSPHYADAPLSIELKGTVYADEGLLLHCLTNLIDNSLKYIDHSEPKILVYTLDTEEVISIVVEDNGPGIPLTKRKSIFEAFSRLHGSEISGLGLGLNIVKKVVELHQAQIDVGKALRLDGARFQLTFAKDSSLNMNCKECST